MGSKSGGNSYCEISDLAVKLENRNIGFDAVFREILWEGGQNCWIKTGASAASPDIKCRHKSFGTFDLQLPRRS